MCGIVAILSRSGPVPGPGLRRAAAALAHRGPDGTRTWISPTGRAGLGHTLLAINDPEGFQPIASEDGRLRIIVNGQFYGFAQIRAGLERRGHRFRTRSDSEIALHLYEERGSRMPGRAPRAVRPRHLGRGDGAALRGPRPLRAEAALLRRARRRALPGLRGEGALRRGGSRPRGMRAPSTIPSTHARTRRARSSPGSRRCRPARCSSPGRAGCGSSATGTCRGPPLGGAPRPDSRMPSRGCGS